MRFATHLRTALVVEALLASGCGDDTGTGGGGGTPSTAATTTTTSSSSTAGGGDDATSSGSGGAGGDGSGGDPGTGGAGGAGTGGGPTECLTDDAVAVLQAHLDQMSLSAQYLAGHPGPQEATGFLQAPALPSPPAVVGFYASLIAPCDGEAFDYDPYCDGGTCSRIGCSGVGAGWTMTVWLEDPFEGDGFAIETAEMVNAWTEGDTGTDVALTYVAVGPDGRDWSLVGNGRFEDDGVSLTYAFDAWIDGAPAEMTWAVDAAGTEGAIVADGVVVAALDEDGHLVATGDCP